MNESAEKDCELPIRDEKGREVFVGGGLRRGRGQFFCSFFERLTPTASSQYIGGRRRRVPLFIFLSLIPLRFWLFHAFSAAGAHM
jgi:hypothetical protein